MIDNTDVFPLPISGGCTVNSINSSRWERDAVGETWQEHVTGPDAQVGERVRAARLDALLPTGTHIHVIKADIEGFETLALRGASGLLDTHPPCLILFEFNAYVTKFSGASSQELLSDFVGRGYRLFTVGGRADQTDKYTGVNAGSELPSQDWEFRLMTGDSRCASAML